MSHVDDRWFSDRALAKLREIERKEEAGEEVTFTDLAGIMEPRVMPTEAERCVCCGLDAREQVGGAIGRNTKRYCYLCLGRGHDEEDDG